MGTTTSGHFYGLTSAAMVNGGDGGFGGEGRPFCSASMLPPPPIPEFSDVLEPATADDLKWEFSITTKCYDVWFTEKSRTLSRPDEFPVAEWLSSW